jgi:Ca2+-binding RTX toxin-like protein
MPTYNGDDENNTISGSNEDDTINGLGGSDRLSGSGGSDTVDGGEGHDILFGGTEVGPVFVDSPVGGAGYYIPAHYFSVTADTSPDVLRGGNGSDTIIAGYGDTVDGGDDGDILHVSYLGAPHGITEGGGSSWAHLNVTNMDARGWIQGSNFADTLDGNWILGMGGDDHIYTQSMDRVFFEYTYYDGGDGNDLIETSPLTVVSQSEFGLRPPIIFGGAGDDTIIGNGIIDGGLGNDVIRFLGIGEAHGAEGNDHITLAGGPGVISGGSGADTLFGSTGDDTISADRSIGFDTGTEIDHLYGGAGDDMIFAGFGDFVDGGAGRDVVALSYFGATHGITGDTAILHRGQPLVPGGGTMQNVERFSDIQLTQFDDKMVIGDQQHRATVRSWDGNDHLVGQEVGIDMYGGNGNDLLVGSTSEDTIYGENGNDILIGGPGSDELWGGAGNDRFMYTHVGSTDRIRDFERGTDQIDVTGIDANTSAEGNQAFTFIGDASFSNKAGELRVYKEADGNYFVAGDVNGDGLADLMINLGSVQVGSGDFLL